LPVVYPGETTVDSDELHSLGNVDFDRACQPTTPQAASVPVATADFWAFDSRRRAPWPRTLAAGPANHSRFN